MVPLSSSKDFLGDHTRTPAKAPEATIRAGDTEVPGLGGLFPRPFSLPSPALLCSDAGLVHARPTGTHLASPQAPSSQSQGHNSHHTAASPEAWPELPLGCLEDPGGGVLTRHPCLTRPGPRSPFCPHAPHRCPARAAPSAPGTTQLGGGGGPGSSAPPTCRASPPRQGSSDALGSDPSPTGPGDSTKVSSQPRQQPRGLCIDAWSLEKYKGKSAGGIGLRADCCKKLPGMGRGAGPASGGEQGLKARSGGAVIRRREEGAAGKARGPGVRRPQD